MLLLQEIKEHQVCKDSREIREKGDHKDHLVDPQDKLYFSKKIPTH